jgi:hypothetical protein
MGKAAQARLDPRSRLTVGHRAVCEHARPQGADQMGVVTHAVDVIETASAGGNGKEHALYLFTVSNWRVNGRP